MKKYYLTKEEAKEYKKFSKDFDKTFMGKKIRLFSLVIIPSFYILVMFAGIILSFIYDFEAENSSNFVIIIIGCIATFSIFFSILIYNIALANYINSKK